MFLGGYYDDPYVSHRRLQPKVYMLLEIPLAEGSHHFLMIATTDTLQSRPPESLH